MTELDLNRTQTPSGAVPVLSAVREASGLVFVSGQGPKDIATGEVAESDIKEQTRQCIANIRLRLEAVGLDLSNVVRTTVYLTDARLYPELNAEYRRWFSDPLPARTSLVVAGLARPEYLVEIDAVAERGAENGAPGVGR